MIDESAIRLRFEALDPVLDERGRRRFAAAETLTADRGAGGISMVSRATGLARSTIGRGLVELRDREALEADRVRRAGGGRKPLSETDASLLDDLHNLVDPPRRQGIACASPATRGDPESPLLWTSKSLRKLAEGLRDLGHRIGHNLVGDLLRKLGYSLQVNRKTREGTNHPDRDAQLGYINDQVKKSLARRRSRSTPRRRNLSATSRMPAASGDRRDHPSLCACTTSSFQNSVAPLLMASTISATTPDG